MRHSICSKATYLQVAGVEGQLSHQRFAASTGSGRTSGPPASTVCGSVHYVSLLLYHKTHALDLLLRGLEVVVDLLEELLGAGFVEFGPQTALHKYGP